MINIAVIADIHRSLEPSGERRGDIGDVLLLRTVHRLRRFLKPDLVLVLGDVLNDGEDDCARPFLEQARRILEILPMPYLVLPGNHDKDPEKFYSIFDRPPDFLDIKGVRILPFIDKEEPNYTASRSQSDIAKMKDLASNHPGPVVSVQHVPLFPSGQADCPYNYTNAEEIIQAMKTSGVDLSISGHYHRGIDLLHDGPVRFCVAPSLCDSPFRFLMMQIDEQDVRVETHQLSIPDGFDLIDGHVHSQYANCNKNMVIDKTPGLVKDFGLKDFRYAEHSGQLYYGSKIFDLAYTTEGIDGVEDAHVKINDFLLDVKRVCRPEQIGLEVDCSFKGEPVIRPEHRKHFPHLIGAMHRLPELLNPEPDLDKACEEFLWILERFLKSGISTIAHPFRIFGRSRQPVPEKLFAPTVKLLREAQVAAEINYHTNDPPVQFAKMCLEGGVKFSFGSDSHNLYEIGDFYPHLELMKQCGCLSELSSVLIPL